jgi:hypothetical protein
MSKGLRVKGERMGKVTSLYQRLLLGLITTALAAAVIFLGVKPADAGGMGGIAVRPARACLNGIRFTGTATDPAALNRTMTAKIFHGHVGTPINLARPKTSPSSTPRIPLLWVSR